MTLLDLRGSSASEDTAEERWRPHARSAAFAPGEISAVLREIRQRIHVVDEGPGSAVGLAIGGTPDGSGRYRLLGTLPPLYPEWLGDRRFGQAHGARFPYAAGEMARGISSVRMVVALAHADLLGLFGAGGLGVAQVAAAVDELIRQLPGRSNWGVNLLHSPTEPAIEAQVAALCLDRGVPCVSASAYLDLTPAVVRCAASGLRTDRSGRVVRPRRMMAKVSRPEVAERFLAPSPPELLRQLVERGELTDSEAELAARIPVADEITVEADSGGHTDNRPLGAVLPAIAQLRGELERRYGYPDRVLLGAAGGLGTPQAVAAAFAAGADYVVTGTINQLAAESALSAAARGLLGAAGVADVAMAPSADMFELGGRVQVLRRGTMYPVRAAALYEAYRGYPSLEALPAQLRTELERDIFGCGLDEVWARTQEYWQQRDPAQLERADREPRHRMALVFRWYLGLSSVWAITGEARRSLDYQIWCGPVIGAFNAWRAGSPLATTDGCTAVQIARNLLEGAAVVTRAQQARTAGVSVPASAFSYLARELG